MHAPLRYLEIFQNSTAEDGASCHPDEYRESYQEAYEFCEATGMRQIYSRNDDGSGRCAYNPDVSNMDWYTHDCCAEDMDIPVTAGVTYWIAVTGAVGRAAAARARTRRGATACAQSLRPRATAAARRAAAMSSRSPDASACRNFSSADTFSR